MRTSNELETRENELETREKKHEIKQDLIDMSMERLNEQTMNSNQPDSTIEKSTEPVLMPETKFIGRMFFVCVCHVFLAATRHPIWILYAQEFDVSYKPISVVIFFAILWKGIAVFLFLSLANKYGYDKGVTILIFICAVGVFVECIATNFAMLAVGFFISKGANVTHAVLSCIAWLLPHKMAVKYTSYLHATILAAYLLGPLFAGIISQFFSLHTVFWINFVFAAITFIYSVLFIPFNIQKKIECKQLESMNVNNNKDEKIEWETIESTVSTKEEEEEDEDDIYPIILMKMKGNKKQSVYLSKYEWFMLIVAICTSVFLPFIEIVFALYYCVYVVEKFKNGNLLYASLQIVLLLFGGIIGKVFPPKILEKVHKNHKILTKYSMILLSSFISSLMFFFVYPNSKNFNLWYFYTFTLGILLGMFSICTQIIMLEFQPSSHAGYVNGISNFMQAIFQAFGLLVVGIFWTKHHEILFYVLAVSMSFAFILSVSMAIIQKK